MEPVLSRQQNFIWGFPVRENHGMRTSEDRIHGRTFETERVEVQNAENRLMRSFIIYALRQIVR
jgi:hypothetical protein